MHRQYKERIHDFVMGHFFPAYEFDLDSTLYVFTSGRYEYRNKGIDLFIEAEKTYGLYTVLQWLKFGMDERLNEEDLDRIRKVDWKRAQPAAARATAPEPPPTVGPTPVPDTLTLVGISGSGSRRLALINDRAFAANESGRVRVARTNASVHCLEIRSNSVLIELEGAPEKQELFLKSK